MKDVYAKTIDDVFMRNFKNLCDLSSIGDSDLTEKLRKYKLEYLRYKYKISKLRQSKTLKDQLKKTELIKNETRIKNAQLAMIGELNLFKQLKNSVEINQKNEIVRKLLSDPETGVQTINDFILANNFQMDAAELEQISKTSQGFDQNILEWKSIWEILKEEANGGVKPISDKEFIRELQKNWEKKISLEKKYDAQLKRGTYKKLQNPRRKSEIVELMLSKLSAFLNGQGNVNLTCHVLKKCRGRIDDSALKEAKLKISPKKELLVDPMKILEFYKYIAKNGNKNQKECLSNLKPDQTLIDFGQILHKYDTGWIIIERQNAELFKLPQKKPSIWQIDARKKYLLSWQFSIFTLCLKVSCLRLEKSRAKVPRMIKFDLAEYKKNLKKLHETFISSCEQIQKQCSFCRRQRSWMLKASFFGIFKFFFRSSINYLFAWQKLLKKKHFQILKLQEEILLLAIKRFNGWLKTMDQTMFKDAKKEPIKNFNSDLNQQILELKKKLDLFKHNRNVKLSNCPFKLYQQENDFLIISKTGKTVHIEAKRQLVKGKINTINKSKRAKSLEHHLNKQVKKTKSRYAFALANRELLTTAQFDLLVAIDPRDIARLMVRRHDLHDKISKNVDEIFNYIKKYAVLLNEDKDYLSKVLRYFTAIDHKREISRLNKKIKESQNILSGVSALFLKNLHEELKVLTGRISAKKKVTAGNLKANDTDYLCKLVSDMSKALNSSDDKKSQNYDLLFKSVDRVNRCGSFL